MGLHRIKIKHMDDRVATSGIHLGGGPERRKLEPFEVLELDDEDAEQKALFEGLIGTGKIELTMEPITRPLDYPNYKIARLSSPTYRSRGPDEDLEISKALDEVELQLQDLAKIRAEEAKKNKGKRGKKKAKVEDVVVESVNPRAARRQALEAAHASQSPVT